MGGRFYPEGDHFLNEGQVSHYVAYITSGLTMHYKTHDGTETPCDFTAENQWLGVLKSFTSREPADTAIKALEDTSLLKLSATNMQQMFQLQPKLMALKNYYTELFLSGTYSILPTWRCLVQKSAIINSCAKSRIWSTEYLSIILQPTLA